MYSYSCTSCTARYDSLFALVSVSHRCPSNRCIMTHFEETTVTSNDCKMARGTTDFVPMTPIVRSTPTVKVENYVFTSEMLWDELAEIGGDQSLANTYEPVMVES